MSKTTSKGVDHMTRDIAPVPGAFQTDYPSRATQGTLIGQHYQGAFSVMGFGGCWLCAGLVSRPLQSRVLGVL